MVEITSGLDEGELVVLNPPSSDSQCGFLSALRPRVIRTNPPMHRRSPRRSTKPNPGVRINRAERLRPAVCGCRCVTIVLQ